MTLFPTGCLYGVVARPGRVDRFGGHRAGEAGQTGSGVVGGDAFSSLAVGGGFVPSWVHDEEMAP
eukprot:4918121-Heterocapsa_arctica.AAC.1